MASILGVAPIAIGIRKLFAKRNDHIQRASTGTLNVATVTFVNGVDNIGIYTPLFAVSNAIDYAMFRSRSQNAVIRVFDEAGNVIETHEHAGRFPRVLGVRQRRCLSRQRACQLAVFFAKLPHENNRSIHCCFTDCHCCMGAG